MTLPSFINRLTRFSVLLPMLMVALILNVVSKAYSADEPDESVVGHWILMNLKDNTVPDYSLNNNPGTVYACEISEDGVYVNTDNDSIVIPDIDAYNISGSMTVEAFVNIESFPPPANNEESGQGHALILFRGDSRMGQDPYFFSAEPEGTAVFHIESAFTDTWVYQNISSSGTLPLGEELFLVGTLDDATGTVKMYVNGELSSETQTDKRPFTYSFPDTEHYHPLVIGNCPINDNVLYRFPFHGTIKEVRLLNRAITADEVADRYDAGPGVVPSSVKKSIQPSLNNGQKADRRAGVNVNMKKNQANTANSFQMLGRKADEKKGAQVLIVKPK